MGTPVRGNVGSKGISMPSKPSMRPRILAVIFLLVLGPAGSLWALRPLWAPYALAAGNGTPGYQDGTFTQAEFREPMGLAISPDGRSLFVADSANHCVRQVHLDDKNRVTTLAGSDKAGDQDGSLASARFSKPWSLSVLPGNRLLVNDRENNLLRLVDIDKGTVSTLGGGKGVTLGEGPATLVAMAGIQDMVYLPEADSVFYSQPDLATVRRLDLATGTVSVAANDKQGLSHPFALALSGKTLFVSDRDVPRLLSFDWDGKGLSGPVTHATPSNQILAMGQGDWLYGLLNGPEPVYHLTPNNEPVPFMSLAGDDVPANTILPFYDPNGGKPAGLVVDPLDPRKFYLTNPALHSVYAVRDVYRNFAFGGSNVSLLDPPAKKDTRVYRILFVGDSRSTMIVNYPFKPSYDVGSRSAYPVQAGTAKRMEQELDLQAALQDAPKDFEVTSFGQSASEPLFLWPTFLVPQVAEKDGIDLVILLEPPTVESVFPYKFYFMNPITLEGIPRYPNDPEYLLKPPLQRIPDGAPRRFYEYCKAHHLVKIEGQNFVFDQKLFLEPELRGTLVELYAKPLELLRQKLEKIKTPSGDPVKVMVVATHSYLLKPNLEPTDIWTDICKKSQVSLLDVNDEMTAVMQAYYPIAESGGNDHFNPEGHAFFGKFLADELIRRRLVPWAPMTP